MGRKSDPFGLKKQPKADLKREGRLSVLDTANGIVHAIKTGSKATDGIVILVDDLADPPMIKVITVQKDLDRHIKMLETAVRMMQAAKKHETDLARQEADKPGTVEVSIADTEGSA